MSRKHFEAIAAALRGNRPMADDSPETWQTWRGLVRAMGDVCYASNPNFDRGRFERAAGLAR